MMYVTSWNPHCFISAITSLLKAHCMINKYESNTLIKDKVGVFNLIFQILIQLRIQVITLLEYLRIMMCLFVRFLVQSLRHVWLFQLNVEAYQAPMSMGFTRQGHWSGLPFSSPGHLPELGIESPSPELQVDSLPPTHLGSPVCLLLFIK